MRISDWSSDVCSSDLGALIDQDTEVQSPIEQLHGLAGAVDALGHAAPIAGRALAEIQQDALDEGIVHRARDDGEVEAVVVGDDRHELEVRQVPGEAAARLVNLAPAHTTPRGA